MFVSTIMTMAFMTWNSRSISDWSLQPETWGARRSRVERAEGKESVFLHRLRSEFTSRPGPRNAVPMNRQLNGTSYMMAHGHRMHGSSSARAPAHRRRGLTAALTPCTRSPCGRRSTSRAAARRRRHHLRASLSGEALPGHRALRARVPAIPAVALVSRHDREATETLLRLGATGVRSAVDCTEPDGWRTVARSRGASGLACCSRILAETHPRARRTVGRNAAVLRSGGEAGAGVSTVRGLAAISRAALAR